MYASTRRTPIVAPCQLRLTLDILTSCKTSTSGSREKLRTDRQRVFHRTLTSWFQKAFGNIYHGIPSGLEELGFLVNESPCSSKQVQENIVRLVIFCSSWRYEVKVFTSPCTSLCNKSNRLGKEKCWNKIRYGYIQCFLSLTV